MKTIAGLFILVLAVACSNPYVWDARDRHSSNGTTTVTISIENPFAVAFAYYEASEYYEAFAHYKASEYYGVISYEEWLELYWY